MLMNGKQYVESLKKLRPNIYKNGELIEDVTTHPETKMHIMSVVHSYYMAFDEEKKEIFTNKSIVSGEIAHRWNTINTTAYDQMMNANMKREQFRWNGTCQGATCAGWTALNSMWAVTFDMDKDLGTNYHERLIEYLKYLEGNALCAAGTLTDAKGNRALKPSQQKIKKSNLHIVEKKR